MNNPLSLIRETLAAMPAQFRGERAEAMLLAIGQHESAWTHTRQINGPARGYLQFEGGPRSALAGLMQMDGVVGNELSRWLADRGLADASRENIHLALEHDPHLAVALGRLLLWTHREPLPAVGDERAAFDYYLDLWRPGKPGKDRWPVSYAFAMGELGAESNASPESAANPRGIEDMSLPFGDASKAARSIWARLGKETTEYRISIVTLGLLVLAWIGPALAEGVLSSWLPGTRIPPAPPILYICMTAISGLYVLSRWNIKAKAAENDV